MRIASNHAVALYNLNQANLDPATWWRTWVCLISILCNCRECVVLRELELLTHQAIDQSILLQTEA
jgi:hypothetical protein